MKVADRVRKESGTFNTDSLKAFDKKISSYYDFDKDEFIEPKVDRSQDESEPWDVYDTEALGAGKMYGLKYDNEDTDIYDSFEERNDELNDTSEYDDIFGTHDGFGETKESIIKTLKDSPTLATKLNELKWRYLFVRQSKNEFKQKEVLKYIEFGENMKFNLRPTCETRNNWYSLPDFHPADLLISMMYGDRFAILRNKAKAVEDHNLFGIFVKDPSKVDPICLSLNSIVTRALYEMLAYTLTGSIAVAKMDGWQIKKLAFVDIKEKRKTREMTNSFLPFLPFFRFSIFTSS